MTLVDAVASVPITILLLILVSEYFLIAVPRRKPYPSHLPPISVIIPAFNEERSIEECVKSIASTDYPDREIVFVDDGSKDGTLAKLKQLSRTYPIKVFTKKHAGKAAALNYGIRKASNDIIVVADADSSPSKDALKELVKPLQSGKVGAVAGAVRVKNKSRPITWFQSVEYAYFSYTNSIFSKINAIIFTPGVMSAYKKAALEKIGMFPEGSAIEDFHIALQLHDAGYKIEVADRAISYTEVPTTLGHLVRQRLRWARGTLATLGSMSHLIFSKKNASVGYYSMPMLGYWFIHSLIMTPIIFYWIFSGYFKWFVINSASLSAASLEYFFGWFSLYGLVNLFRGVSQNTIPLNYLVAASMAIMALSYAFYTKSVLKYDRRVGLKEAFAIFFFFPYILFMASIQIASLLHALANRKIKW